ncbi:MAG: hypothetical protein AAB785_02570 [Patescibacteria group bacterium]
MRKSWQEKLRENKGLPKVVIAKGKMAKRWGKGSFVVPAPIEVDEIMKKVPKGKLITVVEIRKILAKKHQTDYCCPLTSGIFPMIAAQAAEEEKNQGQKQITPWWRTLKVNGILNPKFPGAPELQKKILEKEGHQVLKRGKNYFIPNYERYLIRIF